MYTVAALQARQALLRTLLLLPVMALALLETTLAPVAGACARLMYTIMVSMILHSHSDCHPHSAVSPLASPSRRAVQH